MTVETGIRPYEDSPPPIEDTISTSSPLASFENADTPLTTNPPQLEEAIASTFFPDPTTLAEAIPIQEVPTIAPTEPTLPPSHTIQHPPTLGLIDGQVITRAEIFNRPITILVAPGRGDIKPGEEIWLSNEKSSRPRRYRMMRPQGDETS